MKYAFFDFDNTLTKGDSIISFIRYAIHVGEAGPLQWLKAFRGFIQQKLDPDMTAKAKEKALSFLNGRTETEIRDLCTHYINDELYKHIYREGVSKLKEMRNAGYTTVIVSASTSCYMDLLKEYLPVDHVICTRMFYENGRYTGKVGANCRGDEKVIRIRTDPSIYEFDPDKATAFGDSFSDVPMLLFSCHPTLVNPKRKLKAKYPEIPVLEWKEMMTE